MPSEQEMQETADKLSAKFAAKVLEAVDSGEITRAMAETIVVDQHRWVKISHNLADFQQRYQAMQDEAAPAPAPAPAVPKAPTAEDAKEAAKEAAKAAVVPAATGAIIVAASEGEGGLKETPVEPEPTPEMILGFMGRSIGEALTHLG